MKISELDMPQAIKDVLIADGISELNEPQALAMKKGLLAGKNLVVASPTASGKTLIAELAILKNFLDGKKSVYLVPLKALASEKYDDFTKKYRALGMRVAISTGDYDSREDWLSTYDLVILSNEKMDSLLRRNAPWIRDVTLVVTDEVHTMDDASRGPTLEIVLTKLRMITNSQIIALSATIKNADEIAKWLGARLVYSEYRPVELKRGILYPSEDVYVIDFLDSDTRKIDKGADSELAICADTLARKKQALVFVGTRRSAEALAEKLAVIVNKFLGDDEKEALEALALEAESALSSPTKQCRRLASIMKKGVAFHHAGLVAKQRKLIEDNFRLGLIKFIVSTPTLAWGLNLPAWRVIIRDAKRYDSDYGSYYIPNFEVAQMMGRAGRPRYDKEGEAIMIAKSSHDAAELKDRYLLSELEPIYSKLSVEPVLRMHVLALVANETARSKSELRDFFSKTFFAYQYGSIDNVMEKVDKILEELESYKFVVIGDDEKLGEFKPAFSLTSDVTLKATRVGKRVAELYVDPLSAKHIIDNVGAGGDLAYLTIINECAEMRPLLRVSKRDDVEAKIAALDAKRIKIPDIWDIEYEDFLAAVKTSLMFADWMNEQGEDRLLDRYNVAPGELYTKTLNMERMLYVARELALLLNKKDEANALNRIRLRIKYGVKEELLSLVELHGIGRARARLLFANGIKDMQSILKAPRPKLDAVLGPKVAEGVIAQLSGDREEKFAHIKKRNR